MKIKTYRDLKSKDGLLPLMDQAFRWPFNPRFFESLVKIEVYKSRGYIIQKSWSNDG